MTVRPRAPRDDREVADREMSCSPAVGHGALSGAVLRGWTMDVPSMIMGAAIASVVWIVLWPRKRAGSGKGAASRD
ncbi:hypothetical protein GCM10027519_47870 [Kineococcus endophyticus]